MIERVLENYDVQCRACIDSRSQVQWMMRTTNAPCQRGLSSLMLRGFEDSSSDEYVEGLIDNFERGVSCLVSLMVALCAEASAKEVFLQASRVNKMLLKKGSLLEA